LPVAPLLPRAPCYVDCAETIDSEREKTNKIVCSEPGRLLVPRTPLLPAAPRTPLLPVAPLLPRAPRMPQQQPVAVPKDSRVHLSSARTLAKLSTTYPQDEPESPALVIGCSRPVGSHGNIDIDHLNDFEAAHNEIPLLPSALLSDLAADFDCSNPYEDLPAPTHEPSLQWGTCTTAMLRNVPPRYTQAKFMREINGSGYLGLYDFLYLPMDMRRRTNRGFAFVNFNTPEITQSFHRAFHGNNLPLFPSEKPLEVIPADIQGFEANASHYIAAKATRRSRDSCTRPIFLRSIDCVEVGGNSKNKYTDLGRDGFFSEQSMVPEDKPQVLAPTAATWSSSVRPPARSPSPQRFCAHCGQSKQPEHRFCPFCGKKVLGLDPTEDDTGVSLQLFAGSTCEGASSGTDLQP